jgi:histidine ammonia-lyase
VDATRIDGKSLDVTSVERVAAGASVELEPAALEAVAANRRDLEAAIRGGASIYGVTTGLGALVTETVEFPNSAIQHAVLRSHAAGVGSLLPPDLVRAALVVRLNCLLLAHSGIRPEVLERIAVFLNEGLTPAVPMTGSVGASGDLAPSAHAFLPLLGEGDFLADDGGTRPAAEVLRQLGLEPLELRPKEALALINGTQFMAGIGSLALMRSRRLADSADAAAALTIEALRGVSAAFHPRIHALRGLDGQGRSARIIHALIEGSERVGSSGRVQDAYSIRCAPQVHGAFREAVDFAEKLVSVDLNAVTDNPIVFSNPLDVVSGGNFHGQSLALALDLLRIAVADLGSISERRTFRLVSPSLNGDLPGFLAKDPGRESGYMLVQITAAALLSELRVLAQPVSIDNVPTSDNQEDHVSMGMTGATLALESIGRAETIIAIELLCAAQGVDLTNGAPGPRTAQIISTIRKRVPVLSEDRPPARDIDALRPLIGSPELCRIVAEVD